MPDGRVGYICRAPDRPPAAGIGPRPPRPSGAGRPAAPVDTVAGGARAARAARRHHGSPRPARPRRTSTSCAARSTGSQAAQAAPARRAVEYVSPLLPRRRLPGRMARLARGVIVGWMLNRLAQRRGDRRQRSRIRL
jgi:hypothetical protein